MAGEVRELSLNGGEWAYLNLELRSEIRLPLDIITWKLVITRALARYLGIHGTAIHVDIMNIKDGSDNGSVEPQCWIRVPQTDLTSVWSALSGSQSAIQQGSDEIMTSIRVVRASHHLVGITGPLSSTSTVPSARGLAAAIV